MSQTITVPDALYGKLAEGAARQGLSIESLLTAFSEALAPDQPSNQDRLRTRRIESLLAKFRSGSLSEGDRARLARLIESDYRAASTRADRRIAAKPPRPAAGGAARRSDKSRQANGR